MGYSHLNSFQDFSKFTILGNFRTGFFHFSAVFPRNQAPAPVANCPPHRDLSNDKVPGHMEQITSHLPYFFDKNSIFSHRFSTKIRYCKNLGKRVFLVLKTTHRRIERAISLRRCQKLQQTVGFSRLQDKNTDFDRRNR